MGTKSNRQNKIENKNIWPEIKLGDEIIMESSSEKVLGVTVNNIITWSNHLYGDHETEGLIPGLSKRLGMLKKLRKFMTNQKFSNIVEGIFTSKLMYGMNLWGGLWDIPGTVDNSIRTSITKNDMKYLQVLQNKAMWLEIKTQTTFRKNKKLWIMMLCRGFSLLCWKYMNFTGYTLCSKK